MTQCLAQRLIPLKILNLQLLNQRSVLRQRVLNHLDAAYGISVAPESLDASASVELNEQFVSLQAGFELKPPTAADLAGGLKHLLEQALTHEFPASPDFEADVNKVSNLHKVYQYVGQAAQTPDGRAEVDRPARSLMRQIANPLMLGEMGADATHFVLGQHWKNHFTKKIAEVVSTPQVSQLRQWIDQPKPMGLSRELQNLVILTYAEQTGRSFFRHNNPIDVTLKDIPSDCELREQRLPDEADWTLALQRAKDIFGVSVAALRKASTVAELETQLQAKAKAALENCQGYVQVLQDSLEVLKLDKNCDRMSTAVTSLVMVEQLSAAKPDDLVEVLVGVKIATSEAAMAECLKKAANLTGTLDGVSWNIFQGVANLTDERQAKAKTIFDTLTKALKSDEHVIGLGRQLKQSQDQAVELLTQQPSKSQPPVTPPPITPPPIPPVTPTKPQSIDGEKRKTLPVTSVIRKVSEDSQTDLGLKAAEELLMGFFA